MNYAIITRNSVQTFRNGVQTSVTVGAPAASLRLNPEIAATLMPHNHDQLAALGWTTCAI